MAEQKVKPENSIYSLFLRHGHLLALSIIIILVAGLSAINSLPRLEDPRIDTRNVLILTPYPGASAERVEALVTDVIEDELRQMHEIKELKSTSRAGISVVSVELQNWVNNANNEQIFSKIRESLRNAKQHFPQGAGEPALDEKRGATAFTLLLAIGSAPGYDTPMPILSRLSEELADQLRNVSGTELVRIYGDLDEEINVTIDPQQLSSAGLTMAQASQLISAADPKLPAGVVRNNQQNIRLQVAQELDSLAAIREIPLVSTARGNFLHVGDIAEVSRKWRVPPDDVALLNGNTVVFIAARMQTNVRVDQWTAKARETIEKFNAQYGATAVADIAFEQDKYTEARLSELTMNLLMGSLVVMVVVFAFMGVRASWIVGLSLPLCAAFTIFSLKLYGQQIHQMSIFGIIIAIGLLIDNAIVITDEIRGKLLDAANTRIEALVSSLRHLFVPLLASTLTTILGFMPIFLLPGNIGDFVGPIAISVVMALIGSLLISLTIIATLAAKFLPRHDDTKQLAWYHRGIQMPITTGWFKQALTRAVRKPLVGLFISIAIPLCGFVLAGQLGNVFFPSADRDQFEVYVWLPNGSALPQTQSVVADMDAMIRNKLEVEQVTWLIGGSAPSVYYNQIMNRDNTPQFANAVITTESVSAAVKLIPQLQQQLDEQYPQAKVVVRAFGQGPPISAPIGVKIIGPDLYVLNELGEQVRLVLSGIPGVTQSIASVTMGEPELVLDATAQNSKLAGLSLTEISRQLQVSLDGQLGGSILEGTEEIPIRIRLSDSQRGEMAQVANLPLASAGLAKSGEWLPASALGEFHLVPSIGGITRFNSERVNNIDAFLVSGAKAIDVNNLLQQRLAQSGFELPRGYSMKMAGDADEQQDAMGELATYAPILLVLMVTTLILTFSSVPMATVILSVAVLSVGLGMLSLWLSGLPIGFNPLLGSAGLIGVAINGSIVVIAAINANPLAKGGNVEAIVSETMGCSRHILSTTFTTVGGFVPLLLFSEGSFWPPLAVVLAGGVGFSIILSLVFTPLLVGQIAKRQSKQVPSEELNMVTG